MSVSSQDLDEATSKDSTFSEASSKLGDFISPPSGCPPCLPPVYEPSSTPLNPDLPKLTLRKHLYHGSKTIRRMFTIDYNALRRWEQKEHRMKRTRFRRVKEEKWTVAHNPGKEATCALTVNIPLDTELAKLSRVLKQNGHVPTINGPSLPQGQPPEPFSLLNPVLPSGPSLPGSIPISENWPHSWNSEERSIRNPPFWPNILNESPYKQNLYSTCEFTPVIDYCQSQFGFPTPQHDLNFQPLSTAPFYQPLEQFAPENILQPLAPEPVTSFGLNAIPSNEELPPGKFPPLSTIFGLATSDLYGIPTAPEPSPVFDISHVIKDRRGIAAPGGYPLLSQTTVSAPSVAIPPEPPIPDIAPFRIPPVEQKVTSPVKRGYINQPAREKKKASAVGTGKSSQKITKIYMKRDQREYLERFFEVNSHPSLLDYEALAQQLNTSKQRLRVWFYNRRAKVKRTSKGDGNEAAAKKRAKKDGKKKMKMKEETPLL